MSDLYLYGIYSCCEQFLSYKQHQMELQVSLHFQDIVRWLLQSTNLPPLHSSIQIFWILVWAKISLFIIFSSILYFKTSATNTTHQQTMWFEVLGTSCTPKFNTKCVGVVQIPKPKYEQVWVLLQKHTIPQPEVDMLNFSNKERNVVQASKNQQ